MNDFDNLLANELQQEEFNSLMTGNSLFGNITNIANIIGTSIGLNILRNGTQNEFNDEISENEDNQPSENEDNQT